MDEIELKQEIENNLVYKIDNTTQIEFLTRKTIVVIDKAIFLLCKQLVLDNAPDDEFAALLNIPISTVRYFKHKMQLFEDSIRARRRAARLKSQRNKKRVVQPKVKKREISAQERFKKARELIAKNYSTNQISKILKISERSVTRFKKRIREEKRKLRSEGKIKEDPDDDSSFKYLTAREKIEQIKELFQKQHKIHEISKILKISERSVRRWKERLIKIEEKGTEIMDCSEVIEKIDEDLKIESDLEEINTVNVNKSKRKRRTHLNREKVQYAAELVENGLSNKEMSMLLEMSVACVRKLKTKILEGTAEELIDDAEEHYKNINNVKEKGSDPLNDLSEIIMPTISARIKVERKPKVSLSERDMYIVRLLRDNDIRTMDIARMMGISERSVTRLLSKSKDLTEIIYDQEIVDEVEKLLASNNEISSEDIVELNSNQCDESKENVALSLLAMNVKIKDIAKMLDVNEKIINKWRTNMIKKDIKEELYEQQRPVNKSEAKEEYIVEYLN